MTAHSSSSIHFPSMKLQHSLCARVLIFRIGMLFIRSLLVFLSSVHRDLWSCCMSDHTAGGHPAVLRSDHASRWHDAGQLYVNVQDSFSCAGNRRDEALCSGFHRHNITRPSKSFSRFENFRKRCGVRLCWHFCVFPISWNDGFTGVSGPKVFTKWNFFFSEGRPHGLLKPAPEHSSKQGKGSTFCTLLVGEQCPQAPFYQRKRCGYYANQRDSSSWWGACSSEWWSFGMTCWLLFGAASRSRIS